MSRAKVEPVADGEAMLLLDPESLDSKMNYRFVQDRPTNLARRVTQGYALVSRKEHGVRLIHDDLGLGEAEDQIRVGDTVLMMCPKDRFKERRQRNAQTSRTMLTSTEERFKQQAAGRGIRTVTGDEGERR